MFVKFSVTVPRPIGLVVEVADNAESNYRRDPLRAPLTPTQQKQLDETMSAILHSFSFRD